MIPEEQIKRFLNRLSVIEGASKNTINSYRQSIMLLDEFMRSNGLTLNDLNLNTIEDFLLWLADKGLGKNSIKRHFYAVKRFLKYIGVQINWDLIRVRGEEKYEYNILSEEEIMRIIEFTARNYGKKYALMLWTAYEGAFRVNELCKIRVKDFDPQRCTLLKYPGKREMPIEVPLSMDLCMELRQYVKEQNKSPEDYLFTTKFGNPWRPQTIDDMFRRIMTDMGYVDENGRVKVRFHDFARHSRATNLLRKGVDIYTVNKLLGHRLLQTTLIYLHLARAEELRERMEKAGIER